MDLALPKEMRGAGEEEISSVQKVGAARTASEGSVRARIKKLLIAGMSGKEICEMVGVTAGYISQLKEDTAFMAEVGEGRLNASVGKVRLNERYDNIEDRLLTRFEQSVGILKPMETLKALEVFGRRKREPVIPESSGKDGRNQVVHLHLPARLNARFVINANKDVIGIGDKDFIPEDSTQLLKEARASLVKQSVNNVIKDTNFSLLNSSNLSNQTLTPKSRLGEIGNGKERLNSESISRECQEATYSGGKSNAHAIAGKKKEFSAERNDPEDVFEI